MTVQKRDGTFEETNFNKVKTRIKDLAKGLNVDLDSIAQKTIASMTDGIQTREIDAYLALTSVNSNMHPDYAYLAGRILASSVQKETSINKLAEGDKEKIAREMKKNKLEADHKYIQRIKNSLLDDPKREAILEKYLAGHKVSDKELDVLLTTSNFYYAIKTMHEAHVDNDGKITPGIISDELFELVKANREKIEAKIDYSRDFMFDYFGFKTLETAYLLKKHSHFSKMQKIEKEEDGETKISYEKVIKTKSQIIERPQDLFMRVSLGILGDDLERAFKLYDLMSQGFYTHATPTLFNAGTRRAQMSSCFLIGNEEDSIEGIFNTYAEEAKISKNSGGIGVWMHNVRASGSIIRGTNGVSKGLLPFLKILNEVARGIDQGGKRKGSIAVYLEPWHADIEMFLDLRKKTGKDEMRTRDLFTALWIPSLFYDRVEKGEKWSLFDPGTAPNLHNVAGEEFNVLYAKYESEGRAVKVVDARELFKDIFQSMIETGTPYLLNKDHANNKSNQKNLGVIKSSNLCTEIIEYSDETETAVCNLSSICLPKFVKDDGSFDFELLHSVVRQATYNCNQVIDKNYYVNEKTRKSNTRHRPIALGVQGLSDVFFKMKMPYTSNEAQQLNEDIFETIYHAAMTESIEMAKKDGPYPSMNENGGAPITQGILQFDMWGKKPSSGRYNWDKVKADVKKYGARNSLLVGPMPTASTSQLFGNTESFEPLTENIYKRKTLTGEFTVINKYLIYELEKLGLWTQDVLNHLITNNGSIATCEEIPANIREVYKTVWELEMKPQLDMAASRGAYICQSQSFNLHVTDPTMKLLKNIVMYAHKIGLKTASYYLRTTAAANNQKVTVGRQEVAEKVKAKVSQPVVMPESAKQASPSGEDDDDCLVCGS